MSYRELGFDDGMPFGKHKDVVIKDLLDDEPEYLEWLIANTDVQFNSDVLEALEMTKEWRDK